MCKPEVEQSFDSIILNCKETPQRKWFLIPSLQWEKGFSENMHEANKSKFEMFLNTLEKDYIDVRAFIG